MTLLNLNSIDRISSSNSSTDFQIILPVSITNKTNVSLQECRIPNTIYNIRTNVNDTIPINVGISKSCTIPAGNYDIYSLISAIQTELNNISSGFTVTYNSNTFKITISRSSTFEILWVSNTVQNRLMNYELGYNLVDLSGNTAYTSDNVIQLNKPENLFIQISELGTSNLNSKGTQYTFKISIDVNSGEIVNFNESQYYKQKIHYFLPKSFNQCNIKLSYDNGNVVDLNGADWQMLLKFN